MSRRVLLGVAGAAVALLAGAPAANAVQLFAAPGGSPVSDCTAMDPACTLTRAVEVAAANDEVIVNPGTYNEGQIDIDAGISIHGVAGQARPEIAGPQAGLRVVDPAIGVTVSYLRLTGSEGIRINENTTIDQVIAQGSGGAGCAVTPDGTSSINLYNSVCIGSANNRGVVFEAAGILDTLTLRNVTAFAPGSGRGIFISTIDDGDDGTNLTVEARNVIAESGAGLADVTTGGLGEAHADLSFSNYDTVFQQATVSTVTPVGTNDNQVALPVFADADLHQASSSPTINAGSGMDTLGLFDVDGNLRTIGSAPDIGADEFVPVPATAASAPSNAFTVGGVNGKKLTLDLPSAGTVDVTDAGAQAGAGGASAAAKKLLKPSSTSGGPGTVTVTLKLTKAAKQKLRLKGKVRVNARITFTPGGGTAASQTTKLKIKK